MGSVEKAVKDSKYTSIRALRDVVSTVNNLESIVSQLGNTATFCFQQLGFSPDITRLDEEFLACATISENPLLIKLDPDKAAALVRHSSDCASRSGNSANFLRDRIAMSQMRVLRATNSTFRELTHCLEDDTPEALKQVTETLEQVDLIPRLMWPPTSLLQNDSRLIESSLSARANDLVSSFVADFCKARQAPAGPLSGHPSLTRTVKQQHFDGTETRMPDSSWAQVAQASIRAQVPATNRSSSIGAPVVHKQLHIRSAPNSSKLSELPEAGPNPIVNGSSNGRPFPTERESQTSRTVVLGPENPSFRSSERPRRHYENRSLDLIKLLERCRQSEASERIASETLGLLHSLLGSTVKNGQECHRSSIKTYADVYSENETSKAQTRHQARVDLRRLGYAEASDSPRLDRIISAIGTLDRQAVVQDLESAVSSAIEESGGTSSQASISPANTSPKVSINGEAPRQLRYHPLPDPAYTGRRLPATLESIAEKPEETDEPSGVPDGPKSCQAENQRDSRGTSDSTIGYIKTRWPKSKSTPWEDWIRPKHPESAASSRSHEKSDLAATSRSGLVGPHGTDSANTASNSDLILGRGWRSIFKAFEKRHPLRESWADYDE